TYVLPMRAADSSFVILDGPCDRDYAVHPPLCLCYIQSSMTMCGSSSSTSTPFSSSFSQILALRKTQR
ncbi:hypothetical protein A2U01_0050913, partial [Trifolium medium]|nr:hypothetical protein [Trifolium medium]